MWLLYAIAHTFLMALVNYLDEWLTHSSTSKKSASLHERIGGVLIMSALMCLAGILILYASGEVLAVNPYGRMLALISAVPMLMTWAGYFYLFQIYSAHQVVPLFGLSSLWLLGIETGFGAAISVTACCGLLSLLMGAYLLDNASFRWKIPSRLLLLMLPVTLGWAIVVHLIKLAVAANPAGGIYFWQLIGIFALGVMLLVMVPSYRAGFLGRIRHEGRRFILPSLMNEGLSQASYFMGAFALASAPLAVYFTASGGLQSLFLLLIFAIFPLDQRNDIKPVQWFGVTCIAIGIAVLELWG